MNTINKKSTIKYVIPIFTLTVMMMVCFVLSAKSKSIPALQKDPRTNAISVAVAKVVSSKIEEQVHLIGTTRSVQEVNVNTSLPGQIKQIFFKSGDFVQKDQALLALDSSELVSEYERAKSQIEFLNTEYKRYLHLYQEKVVSASELDKAHSEYKKALSDFDGIKTKIDKRTVRAPFPGHLGISEVNVGQYLNAGQTIVPLNDSSSLYVDFSVPERYTNNIKVGDEVSVTNQDNNNFIIGKIEALSTFIDPKTHTLAARALINNVNQRLISGAFVKVELNVAPASTALLIPQTAIVYRPEGSFVYVVTNKIVHLQKVAMGREQHSNLIITNGLKDGDMVVIEGQINLFDGATVNT